MTEFIYRWLPIVFGCHCRAERSFFLRGRQFPICARCTGELAGILILGITYGIYHPSAAYAVILLVPMIIDGGIQFLTAYESTNARRFLTGLPFGYGLFHLLVTSSIAVYWYGYDFMRGLLPL